MFSNRHFNDGKLELLLDRLLKNQWGEKELCGFSMNVISVFLASNIIITVYEPIRAMDSLATLRDSIETSREDSGLLLFINKHRFLITHPSILQLMESFFNVSNRDLGK
jgi:hypothetical protein